MSVLPVPERIQTERLVLREPTLEDAPAIFERYAQDPEVVRYLSWRAHRSIEDTYAFLRHCHALRQSGEGFPWVLTLINEDSLIGMLGLHPTRHRAEVRYVLARAYWNRGYMTEALRSVVAWALTRPEIFRVWALCDIDNRGSARVLEKAGFEREGILHRWMVHPNVSHEPRDSFCYAIVK